MVHIDKELAEFIVRIEKYSKITRRERNMIKKIQEVGYDIGFGVIC